MEQQEQMPPKSVFNEANTHTGVGSFEVMSDSEEKPKSTSPSLYPSMKRPRQEEESDALTPSETDERTPLLPHRLNAVYNLHLPPCSSISKKCDEHPNCLSRLKRGLKSGGFWRPQAVQLSECADGEAEVPFLRSLLPNGMPGSSPQGLLNLGATCYLNTYLQCLFFNPTLRHLVFQHRCVRTLPDVLPDIRTYQAHAPADPDLVLAHLQLLFSRLQCGEQSVVSPIHLVRLLGVAISHQQDIQEFTHLFLTFLSHALSESPLPRIRTLIDDQFRGTFAHTTACCRCRSQSHRRSNFFELCLPIYADSTIEFSLEEYFREERLTGSNKYLCETCNDKCNATRSLRLLSLPPVLHLQLMRFVYDKKTNSKRKLHFQLDIPLVLGFKRISASDGRTEEATVFDLSAIIMHSGETTHSGHYTVEVRCELTDRWFRLNDDTVTDSELVTWANRRKRITSKNAYMLVYTMRGRLLERSPKPPLHLLKRVREANAKTRRTRQLFESRREALARFVSHRKAQIDRFWRLHWESQILDDDSATYYMIDIRWLRCWSRGQRFSGDGRLFEDEENLDQSCPGPITNHSLLCEHGLLDPRRRKEMLRLSEDAWAMLSNAYGFDVALPVDGGSTSLCSVCASEVYSEQQASRLQKRHRLGYGFHSFKAVNRLRDIIKRRRTFPSTQPPTFSAVYPLPLQWFDKMTAWFRNPSSEPHPGPITTSQLFCVHGLLYYEPYPFRQDDLTSTLSSVAEIVDGAIVVPPPKRQIPGTPPGVLTVVSKADYDFLHSEFGSDTNEVVTFSFSNVDKSRTGLARSWTAVTTDVSMPICAACACEAAKSEVQATFQGGTIRIRRADPTVGAPESAASRTRPARSKSSSALHSVVFTVDASPVDTVKELKIKIEQVSGIAVGVQQLSVGDSKLDDDHARLSECSLSIDSTLLLLIDDLEHHGSEGGFGGEELGFFGTGLHKAVEELDAGRRRREATTKAKGFSESEPLRISSYWVPVVPLQAVVSARMPPDVLEGRHRQAVEHMPIFQRLYTTLSALAMSNAS